MKRSIKNDQKSGKKSDKNLTFIDLYWTTILADPPQATIYYWWFFRLTVFHEKKEGQKRNQVQRSAADKKRHMERSFYSFKMAITVVNN